MRKIPASSMTIAFAAAVYASVGPLFAGGLDRFDQDVSLLFDPANAVLDTSASYVVTSSHYNSVNGVQEQVPLGEDFPILSLKLKFTPTQNAACLLNAGQPFGIDIDHGSHWSKADIIVAQHLWVGELGLTCSYRADMGASYLRGIAGVTRDFAHFEQAAINDGGLNGSLTTDLDFRGETSSGRAGIAYEIPSKAFVASVMYYAPLSFDLAGRITHIPLGNNVFLASVPIQGQATLPQAIEGSVRGVIAPGWLAGASIKWMDWSVLDHVPFRVAAASGPLAAGTEIVDLKTYFRDGWTTGVFLAHAIDSQWSVGVRAVWDRGVTTGWTEQTDTWSLHCSAKYQLNDMIEISGGLGVAWLTSGAIDKRRDGAPFNATFDDSIALLLQAGLTSRF